MAKQIKTSLDFNKNEIQNVVVQKLTSAPASPASGQIYFNTTDNAFYYYNGSAWVKLTATPNVTSIGSAGSDVYKGVNGTTLEFRKVKSGSGSVIVDIDGDSIRLTLDASGINHGDLGGIGSNSHAQIDTHIASVANPHATTKAQVGLGNVVDFLQLKDADKDTDGTLSGNSDVKIPSQKAVKTYTDTKFNALQSQVAGGLIYKGNFDGTKTIALNGITAITKGWFWKVNLAGTASGIDTPSGTGLSIGDMVIANQDAASAPTAAMFDGVDNTESADLVKLAATQTLTNKTINLDNNTVSNIQTSHFKTGSIDTDTTLAANSDTKLSTQKAVKGYVDAKLALKTNYYKGTITAAAGGTITAVTHTCGTAPHVQVFEVSGANASLIEVDITVATATGDVTWSASAAFTGFIVIIGK
jgi:hypothetical protein